MLVQEVKTTEIDPLELLYNQQAQEQQPLSELDKMRLTRYIFNPGREIDLRGRKMNMKKLFRVRLNAIKTWTPIQESPRRYEESSNVTHEPLSVYASHLAEELCDVYAMPFKVMEVQEFLGLPEDVVLNIQKLVLPVYPKTTPQLIIKLEEALDNLSSLFYKLDDLGQKINQPNLAELVQSAYTKMLQISQEAFVIQSEQLDTAILERQNHESTGKKFFDQADIELAKLLEREGELTYKQPTMTEALEGLATKLRTQDPVAQESTIKHQEKPARAMKRCVFCANDIFEEAIYCQYCHKNLKQDNK